MSTRSGYLADSAIRVDLNPFITLDLRGYAGILWPPAVSLMQGSHGSANALHSFPVNSYAVDRIGHKSSSFFDDFYNRIHVTPSGFDLGTLVGDVIETVELWNAYLESKTLSAINGVNADGITIEGSPNPPTILAPNELRSFVLTTLIEGNAAIDAVFTFGFPSANSPTVSIVGARSVVFAFPPNWADRITDRREWRTDIIEAFDGSEQRRRTRGSPRRQIEYSLGEESQSRRFLMSAAWDIGARSWQLPIWFDGQAIQSDLPIGSTSIAIDTTDRDFVVGGVVVLMGPTSRPNELVEVLSFTSSLVTFKRPTVKYWGAGTMIYPARVARLDGNFSATAFTGDFSISQVRFDVLTPSNWAEALPITVYRGLPVLTEKPNWVRDPSLAFQRLAERFDDGIGISTQYDRAGIPLTRQVHDWALLDKAEISRLLGLMYGLHGRCGEIWVPTWRDDLKLVAPIGAGDVSIQVEWLGYTLHIQRDLNRRDIRIELANGNIHYRRITASSVLSDEIESIGIDSALGVSVAVEDIVQISFVSLCRSDSDILELDYWQGDVADATTAWRGVRHDV